MQQKGYEMLKFNFNCNFSINRDIAVLSAKEEGLLYELRMKKKSKEGYIIYWLNNQTFDIIELQDPFQPENQISLDIKRDYTNLKIGKLKYHVPHSKGIVVDQVSIVLTPEDSWKDL